MLHPVRLATFVAGFVVFVSPACSRSRPAEPAHDDSIDQFVLTAMERAKVPGVALAIVDHGRLVKAKGYGMANLELQVPVTPATVFQSGSIGKTFTAAEVLLLSEDGKLKLDDPISKFLRGTPPAWKEITVRHLLSHTSGLPDYGEDSSWLDLHRNYTEEELLQIIASHPLLRAPGDEWIYSNAGYTLLGMIIRNVTGAHWGVFLKQRIFDPLEMTTARVISEADIVPNRAAGYRLAEGEIKNQEWVAPSHNAVAEGSLYFTVLDLVKWDAALAGDRLLSNASKEAMWSPTRLNDGRLVSYGLGWFLQDEPGRRAVEHDGEWQGFRTYIGRYVDDGLTIVMLGNSSSPMFLPPMLSHRIAGMVHPNLALPTRTAIKMSPEALAEYAGAYRLPSGLVYRYVQKDDGLDFTIGDQVLAHLVPAGNDLFFSPAFPDATNVFARDTAGKIQWVRSMPWPSRPDRAERIAGQ
jgi:CubicO group peptidase (beta-lactamase class C family)